MPRPGAGRRLAVGGGASIAAASQCLRGVVRRSSGMAVAADQGRGGGTTFFSCPDNLEEGQQALPRIQVVRPPTERRSGEPSRSVRGVRPAVLPLRQRRPRPRRCTSLLRSGRLAGNQRHRYRTMWDPAGMPAALRRAFAKAWRVAVSQRHRRPPRVHCAASLVRTSVTST